MKTAMQQLIEILELAKGAPIPTNVKAQFLAKERQQIIDAYLMNPMETIYKNNGSDYYTKTYNNEHQTT